MSFKVKLILSYILLIIVVIFFTGFFVNIFIGRNFNQIIIHETPAGFEVFMVPHAKRFLAAIRFSLMLVSIIAIIIGTLIAFFISRFTTNPIKEMVEFSKRIERGNYSARININTNDEIGGLAKALNHMAEHLSEIEKMRKTLVQNVSHDLRTPLAVIKGYLETLNDEAFTKEERKRSMQIIKNETERMESMLEELSELSLIDSKKYKLNLEKINLNEVVSETVEIMKIEAEKKGLFLKMEQDRASYILADKKRIKEILMNLLSNAIKFTEKGGVYIKSYQDEKNAVISIKDTGKGIAKEEIPHIFERFYRGEKSRSAKTGGLGIGLTIVKELVYAHKGRIKIKSELNKGTEFKVYFPKLSS